MGRLFLILAFLFPVICRAQDQSLTVDDLLTLSSLSPKNFDNYIDKRGFPVKQRSLVENCMGFTFSGKKNSNKPDTLHPARTIDVYKNDDTWCIAFHTTSRDEYINGRSRLKQMNFFSNNMDTDLAKPLLFQKRTITVEASSGRVGDNLVYTFLVKNKELPERSKVQYADDLLRFDSHEYLASFFGENNVKKDVYYLSENESRNCSVLYPNTNHQVVFIWDDAGNFRKILFIQVSGAIAATSTANFNGGISQNTWTFRNGIYSGMMIKDLLDINAGDFRFYGFNSDYSLMVEPKNTGKINFKRMGVRLTCFNCTGSRVMNQPEVSAETAVDNNLAIHVSSIMISP
ncbi:MAG: hypothetical protein Q8941_15895 [Bacteroidota bacterium]|nr:hypothetical protein [Bacteroidota bacterium]